MKQFYTTLVATTAALLFTMTALAETATDSNHSNENSNTMEIISYSIGQQIAQYIQQNSPEADIASVKAGMDDTLNNNPPKYSQTEIQAAMSAFQAEAQAAANAELQTNLAAAEAFLAENKTKDGVQTTASGLQYKIINNGEGPKPKPSDTVEVHYHGTLIDGTVFDSSVDRGDTIEFGVTGVIQGWVEALQLMPVGSKYMLYIHPDLAYGERATGKIGPNSALIFEVQLIAIK